MTTLLEATAKGYHEYFGPCNAGEAWMIDNAIKDIKAVGRDAYVVVQYGQDGQMIMVKPMIATKNGQHA